MAISAMGPDSIVRVLQEDWAVFRNLRRTAARFTERTGIAVEAWLGAIPEFPAGGWTGDADVELWDLTHKSFDAAEPAFDLVGADEVLLHGAARAGLVEPLDAYVARDSYALDDFEPAALDAVSLDGVLYGIPYVDASNVLIYRHDLFERYEIPVPQTMAELTTAAAAVQRAVRSDGDPNFVGITLRGAPSNGLNFWILSSSWGPSWGVQWFDDDGSALIDTPEFRAAVEHYVTILRQSGPPGASTMGFMECMDLYRRGRAAMVIEPANEASITIDLGGPIAEATRTTLVPAGPLGIRHAGLYCPPYAIPARSSNKEAAWELAKFLCAPEQLLDDARQCGLVEVARRSVLSDERFAARFPAHLVETTRATRPIASVERPMNSLGHAVGDIVGFECAEALAGRQTVAEALRNSQHRVSALGRPTWTWGPESLSKPGIYG